MNDPLKVGRIRRKADEGQLIPWRWVQRKRIGSGQQWHGGP